MDPKSLHDQLLAQMPPGASHPKDTCPLCSGASTTKEIASEEGRNGMTDAEMKAALDAKDAELAELRKQVNEFSASKTESEIQAKIDAAVAAKQTEFEEVQSKLDSAVLEAQNEKSKREDLEAFLEAAKAEQEQAAEIASRMEDRVAKVREAANFPEDYLTKNAERFAAMADDDFEKALADWAAISGDTGKIPRKTSLETTRETANLNGKDVMREIMGLRFQGVDTREIASRGTR